MLGFLTLFVVSTTALNDGLGRTPVMGFNSWTAYGCGVTENDLLDAAAFFTSSGLQEAGYRYINTDDCWMSARNDTTGQIMSNKLTFPGGIPALTATLHAQGFKFGIYTAASSVVCSGHVGSLYNEGIDALTFAAWGVDLVKYDSCGEYSLGLARFTAFADAVALTGRPMIISTEPFSLTPNPLHASFAHYFRTGNDISADWGTILNRIDMNARWWPFVGPGHFGDPDMLQVGNGALTDAECRSHFGLWAIAKAPLILGSNVRKLSPTQLAIVGNKDVIAVNQDPLGLPARKLAFNGNLAPLFLGLAPCWLASVNTTASDGSGPGWNAVTSEGMQFSVQTINASAGTFALVAKSTGRCVGLRTYTSAALIPFLVPCDWAADDTQIWTAPAAPGASVANPMRGITALISASSGRAAGLALAVANSTLTGAVHGNDAVPLPDAAYGITSLVMTQYLPEPPCNNRNCQNYAPEQSWYYSARLGTVQLANMEGNMYRCFEGPCYQLTSHLPGTATNCLAQVASISNDGIDPTTDSTGGEDVYGGPLANGDYVFGLLNRNNAPASVTALFSMLERPGIDNTTPACAQQLFSGVKISVVGNITLTLAAHDMEVVRVTFGATSC